MNDFSLWDILRNLLLALRWTVALSAIALAIPNHSQGWPMASLKPTGLPPDSSRRRATKCNSPSGVSNAECLAGEMQSTPIGTPRVAAISALTLAAGSTPPWPGLAPCESLSSIIRTCGSRALATKRSSLKRPESSRQPK